MAKSNPTDGGKVVPLDPTDAQAGLNSSRDGAFIGGEMSAGVPESSSQSIQEHALGEAVANSVCRISPEAEARLAAGL
jgi:hypothetical protein